MFNFPLQLLESLIKEKQPLLGTKRLADHCTMLLVLHFDMLFYSLNLHHVTLHSSSWLDLARVRFEMKWHVLLLNQQQLHTNSIKVLITLYIQNVIHVYDIFNKSYS